MAPAPPWERSRARRPGAARASPAPQVGARRVPGAGRGGERPLAGGQRPAGRGTREAGSPSVWPGGGCLREGGDAVLWRRSAPLQGPGAAVSGGGEGRRRLLWRKGTFFLCEAAAGGGRPLLGEGEGGHQPGAGRQSRRGGCTPEPERGPICCRQGAGGREGAGLGGEQGGRVSVVQVFQNQLLPHLEKALLNVMRPQREGEKVVLQSFSDVGNVCILQKMYLCYVKHSDDRLGLNSGGVCLLI